MNRLFVIVNAADPTTIISMEITGIVGDVLSLDDTTGEAADGSAVSDTDFFAALAVGQKVSGFRYVAMGTGWPSS